MVGFLCEWGRDASRCAGCVKLLLRDGEMRILLQFTKGVRSGAATLWLLCRDECGVLAPQENARLCLCAGQREYCLRLPRKCGSESGRPLGVALETECGERYVALMDGCRASAEEIANVFCGKQSDTQQSEVPPASAGKGETPSAGARKGEAPSAMNHIEEALRKQERLEEEAGRQLRELSTRSLRERAEELQRRRPRVSPLAQSPFGGCARISLSDVHFLLAGTEYAGNSFVCHAYYRYRHLLLATRYMGKEKPAAIYLLVPGVCSVGERRTGELYGFREFYCLRRSAWEAHAFGYYAMELEESPTPDREWQRI